MTLSVSGKKVMFDASRIPGFEEKKRSHMRTVRIILLQGTIVTPAILIVVWVLFISMTDSTIDPLVSGAIFLIIILLDELLMLSFVRPMLLRAWKYPVMITGSGVEFGGRSIPFSDIGGLTRYESYLTIEIAGKNARFPIMNAQLIDVDEFVRAFKSQAPAVGFKDAR